MFSEEFLLSEYFGNSVKQYLLFAGILIFGFLFKKILSKLLSRLLYSFFKKQFKSVGIDQFINLLSKPIGFLIITLTIYFSFQQLEFPSEYKLVAENKFGIRKFLWIIFETALVASICWVIVRVIEYIGLLLKHRATLTESMVDDQLVPFIKDAAKIIVILFAIFFLLGKIYHINITALIGGAGIAGLAIALAAQETLANLLGSFTIFLDKPFTVGDTVRVGQVLGKIESIGFRSTRIRTLDKSIVTLPNKKMIDAELDNLTERELFRGRVLIGLRYDTNLNQLRNFTNDIKTFLDDEPLLNEDGVVRFHEMTASSLEVVVQFYVKTNTQEEFLETKEMVLFKIMELAEKNKVHFAYPSTSVYMEPNKSTPDGYTPH